MWLRENGCPRLLWARENGCRWDAACCAAAAAGGHLEGEPPASKTQFASIRPRKYQKSQMLTRPLAPPVLMWARENGCPWNKHTSMKAAEGGHLELLKWAREQEPPCPWDEWTTAAAATGGRLEVLQWLRAQCPPCPWSSKTVVNAEKEGHLDILQWAQEHGCRNDN
jgi:hypothetical protein